MTLAKYIYRGLSQPDVEDSNIGIKRMPRNYRSTLLFLMVGLVYDAKQLRGKVPCGCGVMGQSQATSHPVGLVVFQLRG